MKKYDRYKGENLLLNGIFGAIMSLLPILIFLVYFAVAGSIGGATIALGEFIVAILISCFLSSLLNTARINSKYKSSDPI